MATRATKKKPAVKLTKPDLPIASFADQEAWEAWLKKHHSTSSGVWLKLAKKGAGVRSVTYAEAVEGALIWGWIDGQSKSLDDTHWLQRYTPRKPQSIWSKINVEKVRVLEEAGRMQPPGLAAVERAKANGRWDAAYDSPKNAVVPDDLLAAIAKNKAAKAFFDKLDKKNRYAMFFRLQSAKKAETRAKRIAAFVEMMAKGEKFYP